MNNCTPSRLRDRDLLPLLIAFCTDMRVALAAAACAFGLVACQSTPETTTAFPDTAFRATAPGDWDDIDAAVEIGGGQAEWVISHWWFESPSVRQYRLRDPLGTEARLNRPRDDSGPLQITATVGPWAMPRRSARWWSITRRLGQLMAWTRRRSAEAARSRLLRQPSATPNVTGTSTQTRVPSPHLDSSPTRPRSRGRRATIARPKPVPRLAATRPRVST